jgi:GxxExxY protein
MKTNVFPHLSNQNQERDPQTYALIGAAMEVYNQSSSGFLEAVYQESMVVEFGLRQVPFVREKQIPIQYKGRELPTNYRADFICYDEIIVELKTADQIVDIHRAQLIHYLQATGLKRGLLLNFGAPDFQFERFVNRL